MNVGDKIPAVLGIDQDGKEIKLSDFAGRKIVLYSYPKANTSGCTAEACSLQEHKAELEAAGYAIEKASDPQVALGIGERCAAQCVGTQVLVGLSVIGHDGRQLGGKVEIAVAQAVFSCQLQVAVHELCHLA